MATPQQPNPPHHIRPSSSGGQAPGAGTAPPTFTPENDVHLLDRVGGLGQAQHPDRHHPVEVRREQVRDHRVVDAIQRQVAKEAPPLDECIGTEEELTRLNFTAQELSAIQEIWARTAEKGRRPGARMPPPGVLKGGFAAARAVSRRGQKPRPFVAPAARDSAGDVVKILAEAGAAIEKEWGR